MNHIKGQETIIKRSLNNKNYLVKQKGLMPTKRIIGWKVIDKLQETRMRHVVSMKTKLTNAKPYLGELQNLLASKTVHKRNIYKEAKSNEWQACIWSWVGALVAIGTVSAPTEPNR